MKRISVWLTSEAASEILNGEFFYLPTKDGYIIIDSWAGGVAGKWCITLEMPEKDALAFSLKYEVIGERGSEYNAQLQYP